MKIILAWMDWSMYCRDYYYKFPKNLCSLFWRSLFSVLMIPLVWPGHIWNMAFTKNNFKNQMEAGGKLYYFSAGALHITAAVLGKAIDSIVYKSTGYNILMMSEDIVIVYLKACASGIIFAVIIMAGALIVFSMGYGVVRGFSLARGDKRLIPKDNIVIQGVRAVKEKYCPIIGWSDITNN